MAEFFTQLFNSIFTPGPTPTLVVATNASFAALQVLLLTLVLTTWNIHFMILSVLTAGLWSAINWFVRELEIAKAQQANTKEKGRDAGGGSKGLSSRVTAADDSGTETEDASSMMGSGGGKGTGMVVDEARMRENMRLRVQSDEKLRRASLSGTDSEWDKIDVEDDETAGNEG